MTLSQRDVFLLEEARVVLSNFPELTDQEKQECVNVWADDVYESDLIVYRNGKKAILEGRNSALAALQTICRERVVAKASRV